MDGIRFPKDLRLYSVVVRTPKGFEVNMYNMFTEINIYEDITQNTMSGNLVVVDSLNLISTVPFVGEEFVDLVFRSPQYTDNVTLSFQIYKISERYRTNDRTQTYTLHFCSVEQVQNFEMSISRPFDGEISNTVQQIFLEDFATIKSLTIHPAKYPIKGVVPNWTPFKWLNWLAERSVDSETDGSSYVCFENKKGFVFSSLEKLSQQQPIAEYVVGINNLRDQTTGRQGYRKLDEAIKYVDSYVIKPSFDQISNRRSGMYNSTMYTYDISTKTYDKKVFSYDQSFDKFGHVESNKLISKTNLVSDSELSALFFVAKHSNLYTGLTDNEHFEAWVQQRASLIASYHQQQIEITVPGDTNVNVGDTCVFRCPSLEPTSDQRTEDPLYSGKYLITSIRHLIKPDQHEMTMELSRDSAKNAIEHISGGGSTVQQTISSTVSI